MGILKKRTSRIFEIAPLFTSFFTMSWIIRKSAILGSFGTPALNAPLRRFQDLPQLPRLLHQHIWTGENPDCPYDVPTFHTCPR